MIYITATFSNEPITLLLVAETKSIAFVPAAALAPFFDGRLFFDAMKIRTVGDATEWDYETLYNIASEPMLADWLQRQSLTQLEQFQVFT